MLMLSGIQHYMFCSRQWALIHLEQQWNENRLTVEGNILHENVDNPFYRQSNNGKITLRSIHIASKELGLYGITDAVELIPSDGGVPMNGHPGLWNLYPIEYKRGHEKPDERDEVQLAAQAICLEEMYHTTILNGALFYDEMKHRVEIPIGKELRTLTRCLAEEMHQIFSKGTTPTAEFKASCRRCSLFDLCVPSLSKLGKVATYLKSNLYEETT